MSTDLLASVQSRNGHFRLESGYHTDVWLTLDGLFMDADVILPAVDVLAERLKPYAPTAVCGPFVGGAFLAQLLAMRLHVLFFFAQPAPSPAADGLFAARYELTPALQHRIAGERVVVVDDVISAGSSVRATIASASSADANVVAVAALVVLGSAALEHFARTNVPVETLEHRPFTLWTPHECPLCMSHLPLQDPSSTFPVSGRRLQP